MARTDALDRILADGFDAYLLFDEGTVANLYYLTGFEAADRVAYLRRPDESVLLVPQLEARRAREDARVDAVRSFGEFAADDVRDDAVAELDVLAAFLDEYDATSVAVPPDFPLAAAQRLSGDGVTVEPTADAVADARVRKDDDELAALREAQAATQRAMRVAETTLRGGVVRDGVVHSGGEPLTAERVRGEVEAALLEEGCRADGTIVASGPGGADPHWRGSGPIRVGEPVVVDIFPRHDSHYYGDMTRTFVRGDPPAALRRMHDAVLVARAASFDVLADGAGVTGAAVHDAVCDVFAARDFDTVRDGAVTTGFVHSTGHAVGLDVHEPPRLSGDCGELEAGTVFTVEPGLYDPAVGGVRVEDMVVVTEDGYENFNDYPTTMAVG